MVVTRNGRWAALLGLMSAILSVSMAGAEDARVQASMAATNVNGDALDIEVEFINQTNKDLCYFSHHNSPSSGLRHDFAPRLMTKDGKEFPYFPYVEGEIYIEPPMPSRDTVEVLWKSATRRQELSFGTNRPFSLLCSADDVASVTYAVSFYDCVELFKTHGNAKPLYVRTLVAKPVNDVPPVPIPKLLHSCFQRSAQTH